MNEEYECAIQERDMNIVVLSKWNWEPSELAYVEEHLGPIVSPNTYSVVVLSRTPSGWRWYAWSRLKSEKWLVVARDLEELVREILEKTGGEMCQKQGS